MADIGDIQARCNKKFEQLHNLLWNECGLTPEKAMGHLIFFFAYRLLEPHIDELGLDEVCKWSYISRLDDPNLLFEELGRGIKEFRSDHSLKPFFLPKHDINRVLILEKVVREINSFTDEDLQHDVFGNIFEYMLGRGMAQMADSGQYFTNRTICRLAFDLAYSIKGTVRRPDGSLCTFADFFCGTGGFPAEYVRGVNRVDPGVQWSRDYRSIYSTDKDKQSITTTLLNLLILTGFPFPEGQVERRDSFQDHLTRGQLAIFPELQIDYGFTNPPYGGDKSCGKEYRFKYSTRENGGVCYRVNPDIASIGIEDDDKVSAGVQLAMATLASGGVECIVLPQGFFFGVGAKAVKLRQTLAEEYKIWYVVDIESGAFLNTGTKTSMLVFQKGVGPTEEVIFMDLERRELGRVGLEAMRRRKYSLNYKQYLEQKLEAREGFEWVRLETILTSSKMKHYNTTEAKPEGKYPLVSSSLTIEYYMDTFNSSESSIVVNTINGTGNCNIHFFHKFNTTSNTMAFHAQEVITTQYVYYYLKNNLHLISQCFEGTTKKKLSRSNFLDIQIPLPSLAQQQTIVDSIQYWDQLAAAETKAIEMLEKCLMSEVQWLSWGRPGTKLTDLLAYQPSKHKFAASVGEATGPYRFYSCAQKVLYSPHCEFRKLCLLINGGGVAGVRLDQDFACSNHIIVMTCDDEALVFYVYLYLKANLELLERGMNGTTISNISKTYLADLEVRLPERPQLDALQPLFEEVRHKHRMVALYKSKMEAAIAAHIPGADRSEMAIPETSSSRAASSVPVVPSPSPSPVRATTSSAPAPVVIPSTSSPVMTRQQLEGLSRVKLNATAKGLGLKGYTSKTKTNADVVAMILAAQPKVEEEEELVF